LPATFNRFALFILLAAAAPAVAADFYDNRGLSADAGLEYQLITQEYYNAVIDTTSLDPIENWILSKDEIDEFIFRTNIDYGYKNSGKLFNALTDLEISAHRFLGRAEGSYRLGDLDNNIKAYGKFENKTPLDDAKSRNDGYDYIQIYLKADRRLSSLICLNLKTGFETVFFDELDTAESVDSETTSYRAYNFDYSILSARLGGKLALPQPARNIYWYGAVYHRHVPDSAEARYDDYRFDVEYSAFGVNGYLSLEGEIQHKDYNQPDGQDDYTDLNFHSRLSKTLKSEIEGSLVLIYENYWFKKPDIINRDYRLFRTELKVMQQLSALTLGPLARFEFRDEDEDESGYISESYSQWELGAAAGFIGKGSLFFDAVTTCGKRDYQGKNGTLSPYTFVSVSLMANYAIWKEILINIIFDGDFESHEKAEDDSSLYLLMAGLSARF
jgi:hypothetical protein